MAEIEVACPDERAAALVAKVCDAGHGRSGKHILVASFSHIGTKLPFAAVQKYGRFLGYSGREMLAVSLSGFDPKGDMAAVVRHTVENLCQRGWV
jgi:hypothetical protein